MSFLKKLFGKNKPGETKVSEEELPWIDATENPWNLRLLDLRSISQTMISTSQDPKMASNAISYRSEDGTIFWSQMPDKDRSIPSNLVFPVDGKLAPGVLFIPERMEHKWAIYFDGEFLIFVRSWLRQVFVVAKTRQENNQLIVENILGEFSPGETEAFTNAYLNFLLISHAIGEIVPAPLPKELEPDTKNAALWAFSNYGNMADIGVFNENFRAPATGKLRTHSLLHIAVARSDLKEMEQQIKNGVDVNVRAGDGLATLHWSVATESTDAMEKLIELGVDPDVRTLQGATPMMNAVQSDKMAHLKVLLNSGALVNATDNRGFTALHRAAEMGNVAMVTLLLANNADKNIIAEGHTALSLAESRGHQEVIDLLKN